LSRGGIRNLSLRNIAASLDLAPNALYRYFSDRAALEATLTDECARQLELALEGTGTPAMTLTRGYDNRGRVISETDLASGCANIYNYSLGFQLNRTSILM